MAARPGRHAVIAYLEAREPNKPDATLAPTPKRLQERLLPSRLRGPIQEVGPVGPGPEGPVVYYSRKWRVSSKDIHNLKEGGYGRNLDARGWRPTSGWDPGRGG